MLLALLVLSGCNTAYRQAITRAREAEGRGDFKTAARSYREACTAAPDDELACGNVPVFAQKATEEALAAARPACEAGDLDRCLPLLLETREFTPDHPEVTVLFDKASQLHTERCARWKTVGTLNAAVAELACLQARGQQLPVPRYQSLLAERADQLASSFTSLAVAAEWRGTEGAASILWSTAQCLTPNPGTASRLHQSRQAFLLRHSIPITLELGGSMQPQLADGLSNLCQRLSSKLPSWVRCAETGTEPGQPEPLSLQVDAIIHQALETISEEQRVVRYTVKEERPSSKYQEAQMLIQSTQTALLVAEQKKRDKDAECARAGTTSHQVSCAGCVLPVKAKTPCDEARESVEELQHLSKKCEEALQSLSKTPPTEEVSVERTTKYPVKIHNWSASYHFTIQTPTSGITPLVQEQGSLTFTDEEHAGLSVAHLEADLLQTPPPKNYSEAFLAELGPRVARVLLSEGEARGTVRRAQCKELPADWSLPWVQCWAEASLWGSSQETPPVAFLQVLATSAGATEQPQCR